MKIFKKMFDFVAGEFYKSVLDLVNEDKKATLLDCGCSKGEFTLQIAERIKTKKIYGIEIDSERIKEAKLKGINALQGDLNKRFPFKDNSFDVIIANQIIEHLYDTDNFIKEIRRVLKPRGYAIISTPNLASWHNIFCLLLGKQPFSADVSNNPSVGKLFSLSKGFKSFLHLRIFTFSGLKELFELYGFNVEKIVGAGYYPFPHQISRFFSFLDKRHSAYLTIKVSKENKK